MKNSLKSKLKDLIEFMEKGSRDFLRGEAREWGFDSATCDRKLRELTHEGVIRPVENEKGFIVRYEIIK